MYQCKGEALEKEAPLEFCKGAWFSHHQYRGGLPLNLLPKIFLTETLQHVQDRALEAQKSKLPVRQCQGEVQTTRRLLFPSDEDLENHQIKEDPSGEALQNLHHHKL